MQYAVTIKGHIAAVANLDTQEMERNALVRRIPIEFLCNICGIYLVMISTMH